MCRALDACMCRVTQFCCCGCNLEKGCIIIAILGLIIQGSILIFESIEANAGGIIGSILSIVAAALLLWGTL